MSYYIIILVILLASEQYYQDRPGRAGGVIVAIRNPRQSDITRFHAVCIISHSRQFSPTTVKVITRLTVPALWGRRFDPRVVSTAYTAARLNACFDQKALGGCSESDRPVGWKVPGAVPEVGSPSNRTITLAAASQGLLIETGDRSRCSIGSLNDAWVETPPPKCRNNQPRNDFNSVW